MTVQAMNISSMSSSPSLFVNAKTTTEQSFESFLVSSDTKPADTRNNNTKADASEKSLKCEPAKVTDVNQNVPADETEKKIVSESKGSPETTTDEAVADTTEVTSDSDLAEEILPDEVLAEILSILNEFVTVLQSELQVGEQELLDAAEQIHFGITDFFHADRVKELFLQVNGADASELLTDENLYKSLEEIQNMFTDILENSELYQLLVQEGIQPEEFDAAAFESQLVRFAGEEMQVIKDTQEIELVIDFDTPMQATESDESVKVEARTPGSESQAVETSQSDRIEPDESGFENKEQSRSDSERSQEQAGLFLQKLVSVAKSASAETAVEVQNVFELQDIAAQIIEQVKLHIRPENTRMEIPLNPEQLGRVELEISSKNGELSARLNVQDEQVKEAVESQMQVLRDTLEAQGLKVENIEVTVAEFGFRFQDEQGNAEQSGDEKRKNKAISFEEAEKEEQSFSDVSEVMKELNGNSVDYVA